MDCVEEPKETVDIVRDLVEQLEVFEWKGERYIGGGDYEQQCCPECEAPSHSTWVSGFNRRRLDDPKHKPGCKFEATLKAARAFIAVEERLVKEREEAGNEH